MTTSLIKTMAATRYEIDVNGDTLAHEGRGTYQD